MISRWRNLPMLGTAWTEVHELALAGRAGLSDSDVHGFVVAVNGSEGHAASDAERVQILRLGRFADPRATFSKTFRLPGAPDGDKAHALSDNYMPALAVDRQFT